ncbi:ABC transporter permease [Actinomadura rupiterrae]|uniref:ABC transporter permease n=1 Tax=Actinomadura rupiterrae TaxID=559627 RepID=UPI0020A4E257|nr:ABC transporter permease [Actinomadura rupiterrae]MCP2343816.1 ABC-2 type transport system permease protein [Actinomadura rupiterrae]
MLTKITLMEFRLFVREMVGPALVMALPVALLLGFGYMPGGTKGSKDLAGQSAAEYIASIDVGLVLVVLGFTILPSVISDYREKGVLRRLGTTPVRPSRLLLAQLIIMSASAVVSVTTVVLLGSALFGTPVPVRFGWFVLAVLLGMGALFGIGLVVAAVAPSGRAGTAFGMVLFFPSMLLGGVYIPREKEAAAMRAVGDFTPLGATLKTVRDSWQGLDPRPAQLAALAAYAVLALVAAVRFFRWEAR